jgi:hypothetical protein
MSHLVAQIFMIASLLFIIACMLDVACNFKLSWWLWRRRRTKP